MSALAKREQLSCLQWDKETTAKMLIMELYDLVGPLLQPRDVSSAQDKLEAENEALRYIVEELKQEVIAQNAEKMALML